LLAVGDRARADIPVDGTWRQGPLKEEYTVQKWLSECGPVPVSGPSGGGETISVHQEGDELAFVGGGRVFRTNQCYDQMPTLARETHTRDPSGKTWRTRCTTPPSDPRAAVINTLVSVGSETHIDIVETGRYEISLNDGRCTADIKRTRSLDLAAREGPIASAPSPTPALAPPRVRPISADVCAFPGDPARLEVRPSRKLIRTGDQFAFRAVVVDADGCATRTPTTWTFADSASADKGMSVDSNGKVTIAPDAAEGTYELVVSAAGKSARVSAIVTSPSRYDDLLAASGLNDAGENEVAAVAAIAGESIGGADVKGEDGSKRRRTIFLAIVAVVALGLGVVAIIGARRTRRAAALEREAQERHAERVREADERRREKLARHAAAQRAHETSIAEAAKLAGEAVDPTAGAKTICPACRREYEAGSLYCPQDSNRLVPFNGPLDMPMGPAGGMCPTCKRGFDPGVKVCPHDQDELVPYPLYASRNPSTSPPRAKICPTCGGRFDGGAAFCGKDGTALVLLN
jgi:hypothetical protein